MTIYVRLVDDDGKVVDEQVDEEGNPVVDPEDVPTVFRLGIRRLPS